MRTRPFFDLARANRAPNQAAHPRARLVSYPCDYRGRHRRLRRCLYRDHRTSRNPASQSQTYTITVTPTAVTSTNIPIPALQPIQLTLILD